jgi:hypothetical protein
LPEPTRQAHTFANRCRREQMGSSALTTPSEDGVQLTVEHLGSVY